MRRTPRRAGLSEERRMAGGGKEDRLRDADGRRQSQTDVAVASGGIMDEDNRSAGGDVRGKAEYGMATVVYVYFALAGEDTTQVHLA